MTVETIAVGTAGAFQDRAARPTGIRGGGLLDRSLLDRSFLDRASGCRFRVATPEGAPELWARYLDGAVRTYRHFGVEHALELGAVADGGSTAFFFAATDPAGRVVAGVRIQGPYRRVVDVSSLHAWDGRPGDSALRMMMAGRMPFGVVEGRGAWVGRDAAARGALGAAVSRCLAHAPRLLGARFCFATVASFTAARHATSGGVAAVEIPAVPFPDERYRTVPIWWDTRTYRRVAAPEQYAAMRIEQAELGVPEPEFRMTASGLRCVHGG